MGEMKNLGCAIRDDSNAINTKNLLFLSLHGIMQKTKYPGVAQLVARLLWEQDAGSSSLPTRTIFARKTALIGGFLRFKFDFFSFSYCCSAVIQGSERR